MTKKFKYARLVHHDYNLKKRWYVVYYAWNVATERLERVRLFEPLNRIKRLHERIQTGEQMVRIINGKLDAGKVLGKDQIKRTTGTAIGKLTLLGSMDYVLEQKKADGHRVSYYRTYQTTKSNLEAWLKYDVQPDFDLKKFTEQDARQFFRYLRDEKKLSNKSINNIRGNLAVAFNFINKQQTLWKKNPVENINLLPVVTYKHTAFTDEQIKLIKSKIAERNTSKANQLLLFINFIYYLFVRPNEAVQLRVGDISFTENRVLVRGTISKTKFDEYVEIPPPAKQAILKAKIMDYPTDYFVFGLNGLPGKHGISTQTFWKIHRKILEASNLKSLNNYSIYSYKHSGVVSLYKATKDIKRVQLQCRHKTLEQTNTYLRDLGLLSDYDQLTKWKGAV